MGGIWDTPKKEWPGASGRSPPKRDSDGRWGSSMIFTIKSRFAPSDGQAPEDQGFA